MKANPGKCHLLLSNKCPEVVSIDGIQIKSSTAETLLGITIDSELNFNYCPLIWMFHTRTINNKINPLHERALRILYSDFKIIL